MKTGVKNDARVLGPVNTGSVYTELYVLLAILNIVRPKLLRSNYCNGVAINTIWYRIFITKTINLYEQDYLIRILYKIVIECRSLQYSSYKEKEAFL